MLPSVGCRSKCVINIPFGNGGVLSVRRTSRFPMKSKHSQNACVCPKTIQVLLYSRWQHNAPARSVTRVIVYTNALTRLMVKQFFSKPPVFRSEFTQLFAYTSFSIDIPFVHTVRIWILLNWTTYRAYTAVRSINRRSNITLPHLHSARECVGFFFSLDLYKKYHSTRTLLV